MMQVNFKAISLSTQTAPVAVREKFSIPETDLQGVLGRMSECFGLEELMILSTCNRTEIYYSSDADLSGEIIRYLSVERGFADPTSNLDYFNVINNPAQAVRHLFRVAVGLESAVTGDLQISNQVKQAYAACSSVNLAGPFLHRLMHTIFHANKRVHQETAFRDGAASVSYAAGELARDLLMGRNNVSALVIGAGEMGKDVARNLNDPAFTRLAIANRTFGRAAELALEVEGEALPLEKLPEYIDQFDIIITAVHSKKPLILPGHFDQNDIRSRFIIDLCVPRVTHIEVDHHPAIVVYDIDDIQSKTTEALQQRLASVPAVEQIIEEEMSGFSEWSKELSISPVINKIKEALEQIRKDELAKYVRGMDDRDSELVDKVTRSIMNKIMRLPVLQLKAACKRGEQDSLIDVLSDLFDLEKEKEVTRNS